MDVGQKCFGGLLVAVLFAWMLLGAVTPRGAASPNGSTEDVPAYHAEKPVGALPSTVSADLFTDPVVRNAYSVAARVKKVLYQMPCYCHCDRSQGHRSLLDCFASKHGSGCQICIREDFYSYEQTRKGRTPEQIRAGIMNGEWQTVDLKKYEKALPAER
ncbi:MAG: hypothetical protein NVS9B4_10040 [Candidatus Acidiferrum sp.]